MKSKKLSLSLLFLFLILFISGCTQKKPPQTQEKNPNSSSKTTQQPTSQPEIIDSNSKVGVEVSDSTNLDDIDDELSNFEIAPEDFSDL